MTLKPETLREHGYLSLLDIHFAKAMARLSKTEDELAILGAAVASRYSTHGHICVDLRALGGTQIEMPEGGSWSTERSTISSTLRHFARSPSIRTSS